ncbi:hypothetical protein PG987_008778 [Apiospora arundinis]
MDHIMVESDDRTHAPLEVPFLEDPRFDYDSLDMTTYPQRVGIDTALLENDLEANLSLPSASAFIQAWLWFGLLGETRHVCFPEGQRDRLEAGHFVKTIAGRQYVSLARMGDFSHRDAAGEPIQRVLPQTHTERLVRYIYTASSFVSQALRILSSTKSKSLEQDPMDHLSLVLLSVQILCQTLMETVLSGTTVQRPQEETLSGVDTLLVDKLLRKSGWRQVEIERLPENIIFRYYLSYIRGISLQAPSLKLEYSATASAYIPSHTTGNCGCESSPVSQGKPRNIPARSMTTTCTYNDFGWGKIVLQQKQYVSSGATPYVAISHVRAAGLGNDRDNSLPHCQLAHIQCLVNQVIQSKSKENDTNTSFWIDTLCISLDAEFRKIEEPLIWKVFRYASAVLVLDPALSEHLYSTPEEALVRIRYSLWKQRLWTLEEGFFATELIFSFRNKTVSLDHLLKGVQFSFPLSTGLRKHNVPPELRAMMGREDLVQALETFAADLVEEAHGSRNRYHQSAEQLPLSEERQLLSQIPRFRRQDAPVLRVQDEGVQPLPAPAQLSPAFCWGFKDGDGVAVHRRRPSGFLLGGVVGGGAGAGAGCGGGQSQELVGADGQALVWGLHFGLDHEAVPL